MENENVTQDGVMQENLAETVEQLKSELEKAQNKYLLLYADFENYKKRVIKEKEDLKIKTKIDSLNSVMELDNDLFLASKFIKDDKSIQALKIMTDKLTHYLKTQGIEEVPTDTYNEDIHEVISVLENGNSGIVDVVSRGYSLNGKIIKYPKVIISK